MFWCSLPVTFVCHNVIVDTRDTGSSASMINRSRSLSENLPEKGFSEYVNRSGDQPILFTQQIMITFHTTIIILHTVYYYRHSWYYIICFQNVSQQQLRRILTHTTSYLEFIYDIETNPGVKAEMMQIIHKLYSILCWWDQLGIPLTSEHFQITNINVYSNRQIRYNFIFIVLNNVSIFLQFLVANHSAWVIVQCPVSLGDFILKEVLQYTWKKKRFYKTLFIENFWKTLSLVKEREITLQNRSTDHSILVSWNFSFNNLWMDRYVTLANGKPGEPLTVGFFLILLII